MGNSAGLEAESGYSRFQSLGLRSISAQRKEEGNGEDHHGHPLFWADQRYKEIMTLNPMMFRPAGGGSIETIRGVTTLQWP